MLTLQLVAKSINQPLINFHRNNVAASVEQHLSQCAGAWANLDHYVGWKRRDGFYDSTRDATVGQEVLP
jgi:hypothetical protein